MISLETPIKVRVPASKSLLLRELLLAALSRGDTTILPKGELCDDVFAMVSCLESLGVKIELKGGRLLVRGCGGKFPQKSADLFVRQSAATARFLSAAVALHGERANFFAEGTLPSRPMGILNILEEGGAKVEHLSKESAFPFSLDASNFSGREFCVQMEESSQYLSALLLACYNLNEPAFFRLAGERRESGYLDMTMHTLARFCAPVRREGDFITLSPCKNEAPKEVVADADLSAACYFCALALLKNCCILLENVKRSPLQPDDKFISLLKERGLALRETEEGLYADGRNATAFQGFDEDFSLFCDQALTAASLAPFAATPSRLRGLGHLKRQECDRIFAIQENLARLGVQTKRKGDELTIYPAPVHPAKIETFHDHRVAMAFSLIGAVTHVFINDPACTAKTFASYFDILKSLKLFDITFY